MPAIFLRGTIRHGLKAKFWRFWSFKEISDPIKAAFKPSLGFETEAKIWTPPDTLRPRAPLNDVCGIYILVFSARLERLFMCHMLENKKIFTRWLNSVEQQSVTCDKVWQNNLIKDFIILLFAVLLCSFQNIKPGISLARAEKILCFLRCFRSGSNRIELFTLFWLTPHGTWSNETFFFPS